MLQLLQSLVVAVHVGGHQREPPDRSGPVLSGRYIHILMVFWSFLAGVATFYCSIGPDTLLPNMFFNIRPRSSVSPAVRPGEHVCGEGW